MTLKDLLKKKDKIRTDQVQAPSPPNSADANAPPGFTFVRTTTTTQEFISPPAFPGEPEQQRPATAHNGYLSPDPTVNNARKSIFGRSLSSAGNGDKRLTQRLHLGGRSRSASSLVKMPSDLPDVDVDVARSAKDEAQWEKRATILAKGTLISRPANLGDAGLEAPRRSPSPAVSDPGKDVCCFFLSSSPSLQ